MRKFEKKVGQNTQLTDEQVIEMIDSKLVYGSSFKLVMKDARERKTALKDLVEIVSGHFYIDLDKVFYRVYGEEILSFNNMFKLQ